MDDDGTELIHLEIARVRQRMAQFRERIEPILDGLVAEISSIRSGEAPPPIPAPRRRWSLIERLARISRNGDGV